MSEKGIIICVLVGVALVGSWDKYKLRDIKNNMTGISKDEFENNKAQVKRMTGVSDDEYDAQPKQWFSGEATHRQLSSGYKNGLTFRDYAAGAAMLFLVFSLMTGAEWLHSVGAWALH